MKLLLPVLITLAAVGCLISMSPQQGERPCCLVCQPYADQCPACKDCTACHWCSVKGGKCSVCLALH